MKYGESTGTTGSTTGPYFYVDTSHPSASDGNPGSEEEPWKTLQKAADSVSPGDTVYVKSGVYETFTITESGTVDGGYITFAAAPGHEHQAIIDGTNATKNRGTCVYARGRDYIAIKFLKIRNCGKAGIWVEGSSAQNRGVRIYGNHISHTASMAIGAMGLIFSSDTSQEDRLSDVLIEHNEITRTNEPSGVNEAISVGNGLSDFTIRHNHLYDSDQYGIDVKKGGQRGYIYGNHIHDFEKHGIYIESAAYYVRDLEIYNNTIHDNRNGIVVTRENRTSRSAEVDRIHIHDNLVYDNERYGVLLYRHTYDTVGNGTFRNIDIVNNTFFRNDEIGINLAESIAEFAQNVTVANNIAWRNTREFVNDIGAEELGNLIGIDPLFESEASLDFRLRENSPAIDSGDASVAFPQDFDGVPRPQGGGVDIGAFERPAE